MAREAAFGRAPVEAVVVLQLVERPVVEPQGAGVVGPVGIGAAFVDCGLHDGADRRIGVVVRARKHVLSADSTRRPPYPSGKSAGNRCR